MGSKAWTTGQLREASKLWKEGKTILEMAAALGRTRESVKHQTQSRRDYFPRRKQAKGDLVDTIELNLVLPKFTYAKIKAEARARNISINMLVRETFLHRFVRNTWKLPESTSTEKVKYSNGSRVV